MKGWMSDEPRTPNPEFRTTDNLQSAIYNHTEVTMNRDEQEDTTIYKVVVNHEEQYSIWPADRENAPGWRDAGKQGEVVVERYGVAGDGCVRGVHRAGSACRRRGSPRTR